MSKSATIPNYKMLTVGRVIKINSPVYILGILLTLAFAISGFFLPFPFNMLSLLGAAGGIWFISASILTAWYLYDNSPLQNWQWCADSIGPFKKWAVVHPGFDEAGGGLAHSFPNYPPIAIDLFDNLNSHSVPLLRGRKLFPSPLNGISGSPENLPLPNSSVEAIFLVFGSHEVPTSQRRALFKEFGRILAPNGSIVVVDHVLNFANIASFGPLAWHFCSERKLSQCWSNNGLLLVSRKLKNPWVVAYWLKRAP